MVTKRGLGFSFLVYENQVNFLPFSMASGELFSYASSRDPKMSIKRFSFFFLSSSSSYSVMLDVRESE